MIPWKTKKLSYSSLIIKKKHCDDPKIITNYFNEHFASVASKLVVDAADSGSKESLFRQLKQLTP